MVKVQGQMDLATNFKENSVTVWFLYFCKMFGQAFENGELPHTLKGAIITLIPKKGKDLEEVGSYRPISLLNTDQKILTKT